MKINNFDWKNSSSRKEIRDIRRQIKHNHGIHQQKIDRIVSAKSKRIPSDHDRNADEDECSFAPNEYHQSSPTKSKLQHYKNEANVNHFPQKII